MKSLKKTTVIFLSGIIAASALAAAPLSVSAAQTGIFASGEICTSGDYKYKLLDDGTVKITKYSGCDTALEIPSKIDGYSVTTIGFGAFSNCDSLTSVTIPDSVISIDKQAFYDCDNLTDIVIPQGVTAINTKTFWSCGNLVSVVIPGGVTSIGSSAFSNCVSLESINIPDGVTTIETYAFYNCSGLTSLSIPVGVTSIGNNAFANCENLTVTGSSGSYAEQYALENDIPFNAISEYVLGDVDGDGKVTVLDATLAQEAVVGIVSLSDEQKTAADVDGDGEVKIIDVTEIKKFVVQIIAEFPAAK